MNKRTTIILMSALVNIVLIAGSALAQSQPPAGQKSAPPTEWKLQRPPAEILAEMGLFVYPKTEQSKEKQDRDARECLIWAKDQTGIDPNTMQPMVSQPPQTQQQQQQAQQQAKAPKGGGVKGAAGGAAAGATIGAIAGDAGKGAAIGATAGAMKGRRTQKHAEKTSKSEAEKQAQAQAKKMNEETKAALGKAFSACMDARGYSVK